MDLTWKFSLAKFPTPPKKGSRVLVDAIFSTGFEADSLWELEIDVVEAREAIDFI